MLLPLAPVLVFVAVFSWRLQINQGREWRVSALQAAVFMAVGVILDTEILGFFGALKPGWVALLWTVGAAASLLVIWRIWSTPTSARKRVIRRATLLYRTHRRPPLEWWIVGLLVGATGIIAWVSPPTNFDSMTYQFPRVMHWLQQGSTDHYPTSNARQLSYGPGAVYWQLHLWSLWDGDRAATLVQWFASIGAALALSRWLRPLIPHRVIGLAVLTALALPMSLLQASSSQTDLQVTAWLLTALALIGGKTRSNSTRSVWAGLAFGLAVLTKPVAALVGTPLALLVVAREFQRRGTLPALRAAALIGIAGLLVCTPHVVRNLQTFGNPLGSSGGTLLERHAPIELIGNTARWLMLNVPSMSAWESTHTLLAAAGVDTNASATTYPGLHFSPAHSAIVHRLSLPDEDFAAYTRVLILIGLAAAFGWRKRIKLPRSSGWIIATLIGVALYPLLLKWQVWGNRLLLPAAWILLPLWLAKTGVAQTPRGRRALAGLLALNAMFVLVFSINRPLVALPETWQFAGETHPPYVKSRDERFYLSYNAEAADVARQFAALAAERNWRAIGLKTDWNYPEYVLWRALHDAGMDHVQVHHVQTIEGNGLIPVEMPFNGYIETKSSLPAP
ncbi:MAG: hypothetical protein SynsKO_06120 [Synoicihabitans sp.]